MTSIQKKINTKHINQVADKSSYLTTLLSIRGEWFNVNDYKKVKKEIYKRFKNNLTA